MPTVIKDLIEGATLSADKDGLDAVRTFLVEDQDGVEPSKLILAAGHAEIPRIGSPHPTIPLARCVRLSVAPANSSCNKKFLINANYSTKGDGSSQQGEKPQITIGTTTSSAETDFDVNGDLIQVSHLLLLDGSDYSANVREDIQFPSVEVQIPSTVARFSRRDKRNPLEAALKYTAKLNSAPFLNMPAGSWLCTRIEGTSEDRGATWSSSYEFQLGRRNEVGVITWDATVVYTFPPGYKENKPLPWQVVGKGIKNVVLYEREDFNALGLI